jgi:AraC-like DNA-binding protein
LKHGKPDGRIDLINGFSYCGLLEISAGEVIRKKVLLEAKKLLLNAELNITEISHRLNFNDNSYFAKFFKKYEYKTSEEFRKQNHIISAKQLLGFNS